MSVHLPYRSLRRASAPEEKRRRLDIQGLRAFAVLAVVANHLWGWPRGGFVGVDVFFVVSGFLITGLLLAERRKEGRISLANFYRRRVRRLMPAALVAIATTLAVTYLIMGSARAGEVARDGMWAAVFGANWHFAQAGTDYFDSANVSPLQHFWSLSVEEQYYVLWPLMVIAFMALPLVRTMRHSLLAGVLAISVIASFVYSIGHSAADPNWAYFSTLDRWWELGVGSLLAIAQPWLTRVGPKLGAVLNWTGLLGLGLSLVWIDATFVFPGPWALLPVLSTVLVLVGGAGRRGSNLWPLTNPVATYIGNMSYSLYLWHFPVVLLLPTLIAPNGLRYHLWCLGFIAALTLISYHLIETPIQESAWLRPRRFTGRGRRLDRWVGRAQRWVSRKRISREPRWRKVRLEPVLSFRQLQWLVVVAAITGLLLLGVHHSFRGPGPVPAVPSSATDPARGSKDATLTDLQQSKILEALRAQDFPELSPGVEMLGLDRWFDDLNAMACTTVTSDLMDRCVTGNDDARRTAVLLGDSFAMAWWPSLNVALRNRGYKLQQLTWPGCPAWDITVVLQGGEAYRDCDTFRDAAHRRMVDLQPDLLILASDNGRLANSDGSSEAYPDFEDARRGLRSLLRQFRWVDRTVILAPPPSSGDLADCMNRWARPIDCALAIDDRWYWQADFESEEAESVGASWVDTSVWFCSTDCPAFVGRTPVTVDGSHMSIEYSRQLAPLLEEAIFESNHDESSDDKHRGGPQDGARTSMAVVR